MSVEQFESAMEHGRDLGSAHDVDAVCFGEMGIGNTSAATLICHKLLQLPLDELTGRGTGLDDEGLQHKRDVLKVAAARVSGEVSAETALTEFGGFEIAMMTGAILGAASARILVIVDGFIATAAATADRAGESTQRINAIGDKLDQLSKALGESQALYKQSRRRFHDFISATSDWVWETDEDSVFVFISDRITEMSGEESAGGSAHTGTKGASQFRIPGGGDELLKPEIVRA